MGGRVRGRSSTGREGTDGLLERMARCAINGGLGGRKGGALVKCAHPGQEMSRRICRPIGGNSRRCPCRRPCRHSRFEAGRMPSSWALAASFQPCGMNWALFVVGRAREGDDRCSPLEIGLSRGKEIGGISRF